MKKTSIFFIAIVFCASLFAQHKFTVDLKKVGPEIQPDMYGVFFEDINFGADGGLYAELIKNRSFEFEHPFIGWIPFGDVKILSEESCFDRNPAYVRFNERGLRSLTGLENTGFKGIGYKQNAEYIFSFYAKSIDGNEKTFKVEFINSQNNNIGEGELKVKGNEWKKYSCKITSKETDAKGKIRLRLTTAGIVDLDHISLFPAETWKGRENGLRKDLAQALYDLNPGVFRFPGGCIVEGNTLETRYQWKNSVGPVENRPINSNRWNYTFKHRFYPDYYQSYGLGFYEYFLLSEDLGATPLPVLSCGLACQFESTVCVPIEDLGPYIQDALDLIEFANGSATSTWGKVRAEMGHPEPFNLKYLAIGNEQWDEVYVERLVKFIKPIREKYPDIQIVGSSGPFPDGDRFEYLWPKMKELNVDLVDEHYYRSPEWFLENAKRYDSYDRKGPKVFAGEYAAHPESRDNNMQAAIAEAAFMTGLERNADIVHLATYAPLFAHVDAWQWKPDMIWFDNLSVVRTPNYYVQQMYGHNSGTNVLAIKLNGGNITGQKGLYASASMDKKASEVIVKIVNTNKESQDIDVELTGLKNTIGKNKVEIAYLHSYNLADINTLDKPLTVVPESLSINADDKGFKLTALGNSFYVCRVKIQE